MDIALINISLAFIEGFALIISPCILPILPLVLSGSLTGTRFKPFGIIVGFIISFSILTLSIRGLVAITHINPDHIRNAAFVILILLGLIMLSEYLSEKFNIVTQRLINIGNFFQSKSETQTGFWGGILFGSLIGIVWTPCAGPVLAAVIVQVALQQTTMAGILTVMAFALGAGIPMLIIAITGHKIMEKFRFFKKNTVALRKILGAIIIGSVFYLLFQPEIPLANLNKKSALTTAIQFANNNELINGLAQPYDAPQIDGINNWINSPSLNLKDLKGKVVLIDFWTYSCINCIRTLPYLKNWYAKYRNNGFVIIGIHSPEFEFEKNLYNVEDAVKNFGILYPVALDNKFITWRNFNNQYWPAHYLINKEGKVVYEHFGEGEYDVTENNIRFLLGMKGSMQSMQQEEMILSEQTPEIYLGYTRSHNFASSQIALQDQTNTYQYPIILTPDSWALKGKWTISADKIVAEEAGASIKLHFNAKKVFAVMGTNTFPVTITIKVDNKLLKEKPMVKSYKLYTLVTLTEKNDAILELTAEQAGLEMYTFTFGSE